jgi:hypothetical protein
VGESRTMPKAAAVPDQSNQVRHGFLLENAEQANGQAGEPEKMLPRRQKDGMTESRHWLQLFSLQKQSLHPHASASLMMRLGMLEKRKDRIVAKVASHSNGSQRLRMLNI